MEELIVYLQRIAEAMEKQTALCQEWNEMNVRWREEGRAFEARVLALHQESVDEQKRRNQVEEDRAEQWHERGLEQAMVVAREQNDRIAEIYQSELHAQAEDATKRFVEQTMGDYMRASE